MPGRWEVLNALRELGRASAREIQQLLSRERIRQAHRVAIRARLLELEREGLVRRVSPDAESRLLVRGATRLEVRWEFVGSGPK